MQHAAADTEFYQWFEEEVDVCILVLALSAKTATAKYQFLPLPFDYAAIVSYTYSPATYQSHGFSSAAQLI